jgi:hypothetical protein
MSVFSPSLCSTIYLTRSLLALSTRVCPLEPNIAGSMPDIPYIFIISCIRLSCSERVIIEDTEASFNFSTLMLRLSLLRAFLKAAVRASVVSFNSSSLVSSLNISERSVSILANLRPSFLPSR